MQLQPKPQKLQLYDGIKVIASHSPTLIRTHTHKLRHSFASSPTALQPNPQIPKLPPVKFNALTIEACVHRKFVKHITSRHLQQFELDAHSHTPRRQEQLGVTGMPTK